MAKCTRKLIDARRRRLRSLQCFDEPGGAYGFCATDSRQLLAALDALPDASEGRPKLLASLTSSNGSRDVWWYRQGEDLWESQRIFGVVTHTGSRSLLVDRTSSDPAALELYDNDLSDQPKAIHAERIPVPPHLAEAQRVVIKQAQQAGDGAEER
jgi:hypothetical protein